MRHLWLLLVTANLALSAPIDEFIAAAQSKYGERGIRAARFLTEHMPTNDRKLLSSAFLMENLDLALEARDEFPWAKEVPEDLFLNDVLPYAVFDEPRDPWRAELLGKARSIVKESRTASEAAQALNQKLFNLVKVHYNTGRKRPNQSLKESVELGMATCTGLSIILADACRSVGIPARAVGTPMWTNERGNHTWVEIWDGEWRFTGADEYDKAGLNHGWFVNDAAQAESNVPRHAIYATSWQKAGLSFPMVWARQSTEVAAVNVTGHYVKTGPPASGGAELGVRLFQSPGGRRVEAKVRVVDAGGQPIGEQQTKAGQADLNDMPRFALKPGTRGWLRFTLGRRTRELSFGPLKEGNLTLDAVWSQLAPASPTILAIEEWLELPLPERNSDARALHAALTKTEACRALELLTTDRLVRLQRERKSEFERQSITIGNHTLRWMERAYGQAPPDGHSLWISMHGGGNAPPQINDQQWTNQLSLYQPAEGVYLAPRAPTDTWNLWHEGHIDPLFQRLIDDQVALRGINPNKVYLMGYSAGGDGVWQLAPRMADRFAAAAMMAGHPNEASLLGLRNLPFAIFMGGNDAAYDRNKIASERTTELDRLQVADPAGYDHLSRIYEGLGHWMNHKDAEALPWMVKYERHPWPQKIVWLQDDIVHRRFYWLQIPEETALKERQKIIATVKGQTIQVEGDVPSTLRLRLSDSLLDLDRSLRVTVNGRRVFSGKPKREASAILASLEDRADASSAATATVHWKSPSITQPSPIGK